MNNKETYGNGGGSALKIVFTVLTIAGIVLFGVAILSFFLGVFTFRAPKIFWLAFLGVPLVIIGTAGRKRITRKERAKNDDVFIKKSDVSEFNRYAASMSCHSASDSKSSEQNGRSNGLSGERNGGAVFGNLENFLSANGLRNNKEDSAVNNIEKNPEEKLVNQPTYTSALDNDTEISAELEKPTHAESGYNVKGALKEGQIQDYGTSLHTNKNNSAVKESLKSEKCLVKVCPYCKTEVPKDSSFCKNCGKML